MTHTPEQVQFYVLALSGASIGSVAGLPHVGGVVCASEDEKMKNLFKLLLQEIELRKQKLVATGVSSYAAYLEAGYDDLPQIVLLIDNITALKELYLQEDDVLLGLSREGQSVGLSIIVANSQTSGFGYKYLANFSNRFGLFCHDSGEYSALFNSLRIRPEARPGCTLLELNKTIYEGQVYLSFEGEKEIERVTAIRKYVAEVNEKMGKMGRAKAIPLIPEVLTIQEIRQTFGASQPYHIAAGLDYSTVDLVEMDLSQLGTLAVSGRKQSGKSNFIRHILYSLEENRENAPASVWIIDDIGKKLSGLQNLSIVQNYSLLPDKAIEMLAEWEIELKRRYDSLVTGDETVLAEAPLLLLVAQNPEVANVISADKNALAQYKTIFSKFKALKVCVIFANIENAAISFGAPEVMKMVKEQKQFLLFEDLTNVKVIDLPLGSLRQFKKEIITGDAYYVKDNSVTKVRTVHRALLRNS